MKKVLSGLRQEDFEVIAAELNASKFRARQIHNWIYLKSASSIEEMTDLSKDFRERLSSSYVAQPVKIIKHLQSVDGTVKFLFALCDGNVIESVLMKYNHGYTICISTQVGCKMGCTFCATGKSGYSR